MLPFLYVVYSLLIGLIKARLKETSDTVKGLIFQSQRTPARKMVVVAVAIFGAGGMIGALADTCENRVAGMQRAMSADSADHKGDSRVGTGGTDQIIGNVGKMKDEIASSPKEEAKRAWDDQMNSLFAWNQGQICESLCVTCEPERAKKTRVYTSKCWVEKEHLPPLKTVYISRKKNK